MAVEADRLIGFASYIVHPFTWSERQVCYLEDLFVEPAARGRGAGRLLIEHVIALARAEGRARVYWMTREGNETARRLYDTFAPADDFVRYTIELPGSP